MKHLYLFLLTSALLLNACEQKPANDSEKANNPVSNTSNNEKMQPDPAPSTNPNAADLETAAEEMVNEEVPNEEGDFSSVVEGYPEIELPADLPHIVKDPSVYGSAPIGEMEMMWIAGKGMLEIDGLEEAFYAHRYAVNDEVVALITCIMGETKTRFVLHTHKVATGEFIAKEVVAMSDDALTYGYSTRISKGGDLYRSQMIKIQEGDVMYWDVDHEDIFKIGSDGSLAKE